MGAALYWAEGNKQKPHSVSTGIKFSNSDSKMIIFFRKWLMEICKIVDSDIVYELYVHKTANINNIRKYWANILDLKNFEIIKVRIKNFDSKSYRKNRGENYYGVVRMGVKKSTNLNRKIIGWAYAACENLNHSGVV